jgi:hypothetical protein
MLRRKTMNVLEGIKLADIKEFLGKGWLTHDGMWFFNIYQTYGIDAANKLNRAAIKAMAPLEVKRCKKLLGIDKEELETFTEVKDFMDGALQAILPESILSVSSFTAPSTNVIRWEWQDGKCFAYDGMKRLRIADQYVCGVIYRIECWLDYLQVPYKVNPKIDACIMAKSGTCTGEFVFRY